MTQITGGPANTFHPDGRESPHECPLQRVAANIQQDSAGFRLLVPLADSSPLCPRLFAKLDGGLLWIAHAVTPSVSPDGVPVPVTDHAEQDMTQFVESWFQAMPFRHPLVPGDDS